MAVWGDPWPPSEGPCQPRCLLPRTPLPASAGGALLGAVQPARENTASGAEPGAGEEGLTGALTAGGEKDLLARLAWAVGRQGASPGAF